MVDEKRLAELRRLLKVVDGQGGYGKRAEAIRVEIARLESEVASGA